MVALIHQSVIKYWKLLVTVVSHLNVWLMLQDRSQTMVLCYCWVNLSNRTLGSICAVPRSAIFAVPEVNSFRYFGGIAINNITTTNVIVIIIIIIIIISSITVFSGVIIIIIIIYYLNYYYHN